MSIQSLCIFCGSRNSQNPIYAEATAEIGIKMAAKGIRLVYGGGSVGLMGILADACLGAGGEITGVITKKLMELELSHSGLNELCIVETMLERKTIMAERSDAFIALPGSVGTLDELFEMLTWTQLGIQSKPSGVLNINGFYDDLISLIEKIVKEGFLLPEHAALLHVGTSFDSLFAELENVRGN